MGTVGRLLSGCLIAVVLWGCGSHQLSPQARLCLPPVKALLTRTLRVRSSQVVTVPGIGNDGMPQCSFKARLPSGGRFAVTINVDRSPQPYMVLSRTIVERQQVFSPTRLVPAPVSVLGLGLLASWFPPSQLMSTDGVRLVTTTVLWRGASQGQERRLAVRISRPYLGKSKPSLAKLYP
jgi:hypothetical protein